MIRFKDSVVPDVKIISFSLASIKDPILFFVCDIKLDIFIPNVESDVLVETEYFV